MDGLKLFSKIIGWIYFASWSLEFYPQIIENYKLKHVRGLSFDFLVYSTTGFFFYMLYNVLMFFDPNIQHQYKMRHSGDGSSGEVLVSPADVGFAVHALFITLVTCVQAFKYREHQRPAKSTNLFCGAIALAMIGFGIAVLTKTPGIEWLDFVNWCSYIKLLLTFMKYCPQVYTNYKRKSTEGWAIGMTLLDIVGGLLSIGELFMDASISGSWSGITGNIAKFCLGLFCLVFDAIFVVQHYFLYNKHKSRDETVQLEKSEKL